MGCLNVAALETCGPPGFRDFLDGASRRKKKGGQQRGQEENRRLWGCHLLLKELQKRSWKPWAGIAAPCSVAASLQSWRFPPALPQPLRYLGSSLKSYFSVGISRNMLIQHPEEWILEEKSNCWVQNLLFPAQGSPEHGWEGLTLCWWDVWDQSRRKWQR